MSTEIVLGLSALAVWAWVTLFWLLSLWRRDAGIMDLGWGPGFLLVLTVGWGLDAGFSPRAGLLTLLVGLWALRLSLHIGIRNRGRGEDPRYRRWREQAGARFWWTSYGKVFLLQGVILWGLSLPLLFTVLRPRGGDLGAFDLVGLLLWLVGFTFEAVADAQLLAFQRGGKSPGGVLDRGLWAWSRHPNYFGEAVLWWGFGFLALGSIVGFWALLSPVLMTFLLLRVSGVRMLEEHLVDRRPAYREYVRRTSAFLPRPPRS